MLVPIIAYALYGVLNVAAVMLLKANLSGATAAVRAEHAMSAAVGWVMAGALLYASSFLCWLFILNRTPVARAYPIAIGITMVLTTAGAVVVLNERLTAMHLAGILIVFAGVTILARA